MMRSEPGYLGGLLGLSPRALLGAVGALMVFAAVVGTVLTSTLAPAPTPAGLSHRGDRRGAAVAAALGQDGFGSSSSAVIVAHVPPVELAVPVIAIRSRLVGLRLNADGTLQVPSDYEVAGWYSDGPAPGDGGRPAIIVGHVDSQASPGIFYRLAALRPGDVVLIRRADGSTLRFAVYRSADYDKRTFPAAQLYAPRSGPELRLITCTGTFDRATGHYLSNLVVFARLTSAPTPALRAGLTGLR